VGEYEIILFLQSMFTGKSIGIIISIIILVGGAYFFEIWPFSSLEKRVPIAIENGKEVIFDEPVPIANTGNVSPITCNRWNGRPVAVAQPGEKNARPAAGFSDADIVFEMPVFTGSTTRLLGVYICTLPKDIGSIRSARHDHIPLAKSFDAVFIHWGYSKFAETLLDRKLIDNIDCLTTSFCPRWDRSEWTGRMTLEDSGRIPSANIAQAMEKYGYKSEGTFSGYPHQADASLDARPEAGRLRVAFKNPYDVSYDYDRNTNSYLRTWDQDPDTDKNNGKRVAPKNVVVMFAESEQIKLSIDYKARGVQDPWELIPEHDRAGLNDIPGAPGIGRYNNINMGDPWFDTKDSGEAYYYMNGKQYHGTWKKDKSTLESKLMFLDEAGKEIMFVPGQIWVDVLEPGQGMKWEPNRKAGESGVAEAPVNSGE